MPAWPICLLDLQIINIDHGVATTNLFVDLDFVMGGKLINYSNGMETNTSVEMEICEQFITTI